MYVSAICILALVANECMENGIKDGMYNSITDQGYTIIYVADSVDGQYQRARKKRKKTKKTEKIHATKG